MSAALPPTTAMADVALVHGRPSSLTPPLRLMTAVAEPLLAAVRTVTIAAGAGDEGLQPLYDLLSGHLGPCVLVVAGGAAIDAAVFGQIIARAARQSGVVAALIDGGIRDSRLLAAEGIAVFARDEVTGGAVGLAHVSSTGDAVRVGNATLAEGDLVLCDDGGAVCLPADQADRWLAEATALAAAEDVVLADLAAGSPLNVAYRAKRDEVRRIRTSTPTPAQL